MNLYLIPLLLSKKAISQPSLIFSPGPKIGKNSKSNATELFLKSAYSFAKNRIKTICTKLCINDNYPITNTCSNHIEKVFLDILVLYPEVFKDRKIDQILTCIIHAVCLIYQIDVLFKHIIAKFNEYFHCKDKVWSKVLIKTEGQPIYINVIEFYNQIFAMPKSPIEQYLLTQKKLPGGTLLKDIEIIPIIKYPFSPEPKGSLFSPRKQNQKLNITIGSPMRKSTSLTPSNVVTLGHLKSPQKQFDEINGRVNQPKKKGEEKVV